MQTALETSARRHAITAAVRTLVFWFPLCLTLGLDLTLMFLVADSGIPLLMVSPIVVALAFSPLILTVALPLRWAAAGPVHTLRPAPMTAVLENVVSEIAIALGEPVESIVVHDAEAPNVGMFPTADGGLVVATTGALDLLSRYELQALVAAQFAGMRDRWCRVATRAEITWSGLYLVLPLGILSIFTATLGILFLNVLIGFIATGVLGFFIGLVVVFLPRWNEQSRDLCADVAAVQTTFDPSSLANAMRKLAAHGDAAHHVDIGRWYHPVSPFLVVPRRRQTKTGVGEERSWTSADEVGLEMELRADRAEAMTAGAEPHRITGRELSRRWAELRR